MFLWGLACCGVGALLLRAELRPLCMPLCSGAAKGENLPLIAELRPLCAEVRPLRAEVLPGRGLSQTPAREVGREASRDGPREPLEGT